MQYIIKAYDGEGSALRLSTNRSARMLDKRMEIRPRHLEGIERIKEHVICAGGLLDDKGKMKGSVLIMEYENRELLDEYLANEPYVQENVW